MGDWITIVTGMLERHSSVLTGLIVWNIGLTIATLTALILIGKERREKR